jgi:hypothetical protein
VAHKVAVAMHSVVQAALHVLTDAVPRQVRRQGPHGRHITWQATLQGVRSPTRRFGMRASCRQASMGYSREGMLFCCSCRCCCCCSCLRPFCSPPRLVRCSSAIIASCAPAECPTSDTCSPPPKCILLFLFTLQSSGIHSMTSQDGGQDHFVSARLRVMIRAQDWAGLM